MGLFSEGLENKKDELEHQNKLLVRALYHTLIKAGVINNETISNPPELLLAAEMFTGQSCLG